MNFYLFKIFYSREATKRINSSESFKWIKIKSCDCLFLYLFYNVEKYLEYKIILFNYRLAAVQGDKEVVQILLDHGADVNSKDADSRTTLYILALENRLEMARYLIEQGGADVEARDSEVIMLVYDKIFKLEDVIYKCFRLCLFKHSVHFNYI